MSKGLKALDALCYLDDIAHGRKMKLDPHELKLIVEKALKALEIIKNRISVIYYVDEEDKPFYVLTGAITGTEYKVLYELLKEKKDDHN